MDEDSKAPQKESLFQKLNTLIKQDKAPERRFVRHAQERQIIDHALNSLSQSEKGQKLIDFIKEKDLSINVLRAQHARDFSPTANSIYVTVTDHQTPDDPEITIHLIAAIREVMHEYDPALKKVPFENGEALFVQREEKKLSDKLQWQAIIVYELGKIANKNEFIDSFTLMGYYSLIDAYEKDLTEI